MLYSMFSRTDPVALAAAESARNDARRADRRSEALELDVERLLMISEALWTMLKEKHDYTDEELEKRIMDIDLRDGKLDGRVADSPPGKCPKCERPLMKRRPRDRLLLRSCSRVLYQFRPQRCIGIEPSG